MSSNVSLRSYEERSLKPWAKLKLSPALTCEASPKVQHSANVLRKAQEDHVSHFYYKVPCSLNIKQPFSAQVLIRDRSVFVTNSKPLQYTMLSSLWWESSPFEFFILDLKSQWEVCCHIYQLNGSVKAYSSWQQCTDAGTERPLEPIGAFSFVLSLASS